MNHNIPAVQKFIICLKFIDFQLQQRRYRYHEKRIVQTIYGPIMGIKRKSIYGDIYFSFEKIPFAKPPIGELRFKVPQPPEPWTKIRNCTSSGPKPLQRQLGFSFPIGSEDCLYLNVYTKNINPLKPYPVMVWIYGGGFQHGEASRIFYSPDYLLREDVIVITISYRLGPLGFLSLKDPSLDVPGNAGLKDQVMALRWVKANCSKFGGDANNITLFGTSAGAASVHYMMITEQSKGLFHKAICMSGSSLSPWAIARQGNSAYRLARAAGYTGENIDSEIFSYLMKLKGSAIVRANIGLLGNKDKRERLTMTFGPVIEPYITEHCILPAKPIEVMRTAWSNEIPFILGGAADEGLIIYKTTLSRPKFLNELGDCRYVVPKELNLDRSSELCKEYGRKIKTTYYGDKEPSINTLDEYILMSSHEQFWFPIYRTVLSRVKYGSAPTYLYHFAFDSQKFNHPRILFCGKKMRGTCHSDDVSYIFYNSLAHKLEKESEEYKCIEHLVGMWTHFATHGQPNYDPENSDLWQPVPKDVLTKRHLKCLNIKDKLKVIDVPQLKIIRVWESFFTHNQFL